MNIRFILNILGALLLIESGLLALPAIVALLYSEHDLIPILYSSVITFVTGGLFWLFNKKCKKEIGKREGFIIVGAVWVVFAFFGALPFILSGYIPSVTDAFFEAMSGFTTTGATILNDIEALPHGLLFWRAFMHFTGGIGILVLGIAILPIFGVGSVNLYRAENSVSFLSEKIKPRVKDYATLIFRIYLIITVLCILFYLPDMDFFDAVCHALSTTATGGFSTKNASLAAYSIYSQYVTIVFMLLGSTSFVLFFHVWKREWVKIAQNDEFRFYLLMIVAAFVFICAGLLIDNYGVEQAVRESLFNVASVVSNTGYTIHDYMLWTPPLWFIIFLLTFIGGCSGSTAGGLKIVRFLLLFRIIPVQFKKIIHQNAIIQVKLNGQNVSTERMSRTLAFFMIFLCSYVLGVFMLMIFGMDFTSAAGASIACLANSGLGLDGIGQASNFAGLSDIAKWICTFLMLIGRLELYSVLILFSPSFWKKQ
ncbi:MAG: TrkH family potassium uptake protein [Tannerella sp.]|jgi:trk system potassium uptake protein TrkH|nr:TrkH family potassium uptake protein [Tannerella sp.]